MKFYLFSLLLFFSYNVYAQNIPFKIEINNLRNTKGNIVISVFKDHKSFEAENHLEKKEKSKKENMKNTTIITELSLPPGIYGLVVLDDENSNNEMDYNLIGMPKEGYGFSNFYHTNFSKPKFADFSFELTPNTSKMLIRLKYM